MIVSVVRVTTKANHQIVSNWLKRSTRPRHKPGRHRILGEFGLIFLLFQAGFEFNLEEIGAGPLRLGAMAWLAAFAFSVLFTGFLTLIGILRSPVLIALILS
jgi:Kef-type K+ transport system membrane component KefB